MAEDAMTENIRQNLEGVEERIQAACKRAGRSRGDVHLIAVSKTKPLAMIRQASELGIRDFGENWVQELTQKYAELGNAVTWHLIGHLQRNKVKYVIDKAAVIHSVDSVRLAQEIQKEAEKRDLCAKILIEINIGGEATKSGVAPEQTAALIEEIAGLSRVQIKGLMTVAPYEEDPEACRVYFKRMEKLRRQIEALGLPGVEMRELSMGMSGDFEVAIEEGATMIRVGSAIFGARVYPA